MKTEPNDSAFARAAVYGVEEGRLGVCEDGYPGLTKREYFAAMALQGIISNTKALSHDIFPVSAKVAIEYADALIAELNKP